MGKAPAPESSVPTPPSSARWTAWGPLPPSRPRRAGDVDRKHLLHRGPQAPRHSMTTTDLRGWEKLKNRMLMEGCRGTALPGWSAWNVGCYRNQSGTTNSSSLGKHCLFQVDGEFGNAWHLQFNSEIRYHGMLPIRCKSKCWLRRMVFVTKLEESKPRGKKSLDRSLHSGWWLPGYIAQVTRQRHWLPCRTREKRHRYRKWTLLGSSTRSPM